jgi:hypothetical protein
MPGNSFPFLLSVMARTCNVLVATAMTIAYTFAVNFSVDRNGKRDIGICFLPEWHIFLELKK